MRPRQRNPQRIRTKYPVEGKRSCDELGCVQEFEARLDYIEFQTSQGDLMKICLKHKQKSERKLSLDHPM